MKKYFYIMVIDVFYHPKGEEEHYNKIVKTKKESRKGVIDIEAKDDTPSRIYDKVLKHIINEWEDGSVVNSIVNYYNFWEEKEVQVNFEDLPVEDWSVSAGLLSALKDIPVKNWNDLSKYSVGDLTLIKFGKKNLLELKSFLESKGVQLFKYI